MSHSIILLDPKIPKYIFMVGMKVTISVQLVEQVKYLCPGFTQVLFTKYFMFDKIISNFHISSHFTQLFFFYPKEPASHWCSNMDISEVKQMKDTVVSVKLGGRH